MTGCYKWPNPVYFCISDLFIKTVANKIKRFCKVEIFKFNNLAMTKLKSVYAAFLLITVITFWWVEFLISSHFLRLAGRSLVFFRFLCLQEGVIVIIAFLSVSETGCKSHCCARKQVFRSSKSREHESELEKRGLRSCMIMVSVFSFSFLDYRGFVQQMIASTRTFGFGFGI